MKKLKSLLCLVTLMFCVGIALAQNNAQAIQNQFLKNYRVLPNGKTIRRCAAMEADAELRARHPELGTLEQFEQNLQQNIAKYKNISNNKAGTTVLTIPVVIHIIHNGDAIGSGENITDAQAISQVQVLNEDFRRMMGTPGYNTDPVGADVEIEFCLATVDTNGNPTTGINRVDMGQASWDDMGTIDGTLKPATIWDPTKYMNMWTMRFGGGMGGTLGYAQFPDNSGLSGLNTIGGAANSDGVVASYDAFGSISIAPGGVYNSPYDKGRTMTHEVGHWLGLRHIWGDGGCSVDDFCNDTPESDAENYACPTGHISCTTTDMIENYMDYTNDDCMNIFTEDQKTRIRTVMSASPRRKELPSSTACISSPLISMISNTTTVYEETDCGFQDFQIGLSITSAPSADAVVKLVVDSSYLITGSDYILLQDSVIFKKDSIYDKYLTVRIYNDAIIEALENIYFSCSLTTNGDAILGSNITHTVSINDDDFTPSTPVLTEIFNENFESGLGVFSAAGNTGSDKFQISNAAGASSTYWIVEGSNITQIAYTNDDNCNCDKNNDVLESSAVSTIGFYSLSLTFDHAFADLSVESATVDVSINGGTTWTTVSTLSNTSTVNGSSVATTPWVNGNTVNLNSYVGNSDFRIRFKYSDGNDWMYGMAIDNVILEGETNRSVQTVDNSTYPDSTYLDSSSTIHYYDPITGKVMVSIENLTNWDYQCTSIDVDRDLTGAGGTTAPFWDNVASHALAAKTFYINPTNNNPIGSYNISLYYTDQELTDWENATGNSRNNLNIVKVRNTPIKTVTSANYNSYDIEEVPATLSTFGSGFKLTATFNTGFSGFGIGIPAISSSLALNTILLKGKADVKSNSLNWSVSSDFSTAKFIVEKLNESTNKFEEIGYITGLEGEKKYYFDDKNLTLNSYYRVKIKTQNGRILFSNTLTLKRERKDFSLIEVYPNPTNGTVNLKYEANKNGLVFIQIFNTIGKLVQVYNFESSKGMNTEQLNLHILPSDLYIIQITTNSGIVEYSKVIVK